MSGVSRVLVVGGGIGGLAAAIAFARHGATVDLVEIEAEHPVQGVGIIQPNNMLRALDRIGLAQACVDHGAAFQGWRLYDAAGQVLVEMPASNEAAPSRPPINGIVRPTLHRILTEAAQAEGVWLRLGVTLVTWREYATQVEVDFTDGTKGGYDLVVASDGLYSAVRRKLFGEALKPEFLGEAVWRYNFPRPDGMDWGGIYFGPRSKAGLVPLTASFMYMFLVTPEPAERHYDESELVEGMRGNLEGHGGLIGELRDLITDPDEVVYRPAQSLMLPGPWMKGRIIVIGDAAHAAPPHLAQGAAMAVEDAVLLAELVMGEAPLDAALDTFMRRRFERTRMVVDVSVQTAGWEVAEWAGMPDPHADPGGALHRATTALLQDF